jgi:hypothetical protein
MIKHDDGVSGAGNAEVDLRGAAAEASTIAARVESMKIESSTYTFDSFFERLADGGIVEERIDGDHVVSPSAQLRITPLGSLQLISTHDQLLGGPTGQSFLGSRFPADSAYAADIARAALAAGEILRDEGVLGRFAIDFLSARKGATWTHYAIEVNLRKGGTTHPFLTLQFITDGRYDWQNNRYLTPLGKEKFYVASDHIESVRYRSLSRERVFDLAIRQGLHYDHAHDRGVVFYMIPALGDRGRIGVNAIGDSRDDAQELYQRTVAAFDAEADRQLAPRPLPDID